MLYSSTIDTFPVRVLLELSIIIIWAINIQHVSQAGG